SSTFTTIPPGDTTPPIVVATSPPTSTVGVLVTTAVTVTFSEPMNAATINSSTVLMKLPLYNLSVAGTVTYDAGTNTATFTPNSALFFDAKYTITVTTGASDLAGNQLSSAFSSGFATIQYIADQPYFQGTDVLGQIHFHVMFVQTAQSGRSVTLSGSCLPLPQAYCEIFPLNQAGADAVGPATPGEANGGAVITSVTGTFTDPEITFTFTLTNGRTFTFTGTVTGSNKMVGTVSGSTLPPVALTFNRGG
ncbi:MAG TPA: Ig-like domain-containing protein, partial [Gemmatimonadaceae bacterium]